MILNLFYDQKWVENIFFLSNQQFLLLNMAKSVT